MKKLEIICNSILSLITYLLGGLDSLLKILLIFMIIDYITGICKAIYIKELNSNIGIKGIIKKIGYILIIILVSLLDKIILKSSGAIRTIVLYFFISNEAISILENWALMNLPLPKKLFDIFNNLKGSEKNLDI